MLTENPRRALRAELRERRTLLSPAQRLAAADGIVQSLAQLPEYLVDERIAGYWAVDGELPLHRVVADLHQRGQQYCLPLIQAKRQLMFARWSNGMQTQANRHGIPEPVCAPDSLLTPTALDMVLVPLLGFDRRGYRLGYGGGYYDSSFAFLREREAPATPLLVGVGYAMQELDAIQAQAWDVRLDYIATEKELIECRPQKT